MNFTGKFYEIILIMVFYGVIALADCRIYFCRRSPQSNHTSVAPSVAQSSILLPPQSRSSPSGEFRQKFDFNSLLDSKQANGSSSEVSIFLVIFLVEIMKYQSQNLINEDMYNMPFV